MVQYYLENADQLCLCMSHARLRGCRVAGPGEMRAAGTSWCWECVGVNTLLKSWGKFKAKLNMVLKTSRVPVGPECLFKGL